MSLEWRNEDLDTLAPEYLDRVERISLALVEHKFSAERQPEPLPPYEELCDCGELVECWPDHYAEVMLAVLTSPAPDSTEAAEAIDPANLGWALQRAWDDWIGDTRHIPDGFQIHGPKSASLSVNFQGTTFTAHVAEWLNQAHKHLPSPVDGTGGAQ